MLETALTDAAFVLSLRWVLAVLFGVAAVHKLSSPATFLGTLEAYRLMPRRLVAPVAYAVIVVELFAALALLGDSRTGSLVAAALLAAYTLAILANLLRGRRDIDCGCAGPYLRQTLSWWLVARNGLFIGIAALTLLPQPASRALGPLDWFTAVAAAATFALVYFAANQIAFVRGRYGRY